MPYFPPTSFVFQNQSMRFDEGVPRFIEINRVLENPLSVNARKFKKLKIENEKSCYFIYPCIFSKNDSGKNPYSAPTKVN